MLRRFRVSKKWRCWPAAGALLLGSMFPSAGQTPPVPSADPPSSTLNSKATPDLLKAIDRLIEQNQQLEKQNRQLVETLSAFRQLLAEHPELAKSLPPPPEVPTDANLLDGVTVVSSETSLSGQSASSPTGRTAGTEPSDVAKTAQNNGERQWGNYTPNFGFRLVNTEHGDVNLSIYTYARYLNQRLLDKTFTNASGNTTVLQQRQDFQLQKLQMKFLGWVMSPKFRYFLYAWTSNASQGLGAQVVLAGNLNYSFSKYFVLGAGIYSLPGTRSVEGNFPFWLNVDSRHIADEFFRPSYTDGIQIKGDLTKKLRYQAMVGNNLSILGVSAAQLPNHFNTFSSALVWTPTTGEFGPGFGDFEDHQKLATRLAAHFTRSDENKQSQPNAEEFENTQIRLSDGSIIFTPSLFGPGIAITDVRYKMAAFDAGLKYHGYSLEGEYFLRWLGNYQGTGVAAVPSFFDHGFQLQASAMLVPKSLQLYAGNSTIFGNFGTPWDARLGVNWFPWKNKVVRWNTELLYLRRSPVGYTSVPFPLGGNGPVIYTTAELAF